MDMLPMSWLTAKANAVTATHILSRRTDFKANLIVSSGTDVPPFGYTHETMFMRTEQNDCCSWMHAHDQ